MPSPLRLSYRARARAKKASTKHVGWISASFFVLGLLSFYCVLFPDLSGLWGKQCATLLQWLAGAGRYAVPLYVSYMAATYLFRSGKGLGLVKLFLSAGFLLFGLTLLSLLGEAVWASPLGGILGTAGQTLLVRLFGVPGAWIVSMTSGLALFVLWIGVTPSEIGEKIVAAFRNDLETWKKSRVPLSTSLPVVKNKGSMPPPVVAPAAALSEPPVKPPAPRIMGLKEKEMAPSPPLSSAVLDKPLDPTITRKAASLPTEGTDSSAPKDTRKPVVPASSKPYTPPSLDIFDEPQRGKPVEKEELTARARLLEQTLLNFNIAARVVEIHPGPVITRYDLEPAPGVKVASISSRADDLALAMRSTGIRVLAPIPGKGAVGIEIPNSHPEGVGLKELMARPEFLNHPSPLAFVLGKTVSGDPCIVDLAAMPHLLVAGATGAGKSVCVHAMISSILYRMPPDRVKFTMIDPKRLELPGYSMIPHLYDPRVSPIQAEVITNPKQASRALMRLVKVMEYRYDLFAKSNVRNIDSYNKKRKEAGLPPEYFLVVIIDELADLMITAPKEVEDSIQRLAQMARAVGIHLLLATQRPSVNVITGVIKANLPARIALRVASSTDSRVIIDGAGAESLLGKGDMLYLPPAASEPVRVQGVYVSEKDVENLVHHIKQFGSPFYEDLFSSGSALEFAVEDKKEMKDLIEALKLILERKRVSQDLLKAHFGSSARATNILSLLEVKEFIHKPDGSNRWDINFEVIEEFISKINTLPDNEQPL